MQSVHPRLASELRKLRMVPECRQWLGEGRFWAKKLAGRGFDYNGTLAILHLTHVWWIYILHRVYIIVYKLKTFCFHWIVPRRECQRKRIQETLYSLGCLWEIRNDPRGPMRLHGRPRGDSWYSMPVRAYIASASLFSFQCWADSRIATILLVTRHRPKRPGAES